MIKDLDDKEDFQIHRNAWVKEHGTKRGFISHNWRRYGFANESCLRHHIASREGKGRSARINKKNSKIDRVTLRGHRNSTIRTTNRADDKLEYHQNLELSEIRNIRYGKLEPTMYISDLPHLEWLRKYIDPKMYYLDLKPLNELQDMLWVGHKEVALLPRFGGKTVTYLGMTVKEIAERRQPHLTICSPKRPKVLYEAVAKPIIKSAPFRKDYGDIIRVDEGRTQTNKTDLVMKLHDDYDYPYVDPVYRAASRETDIIGNHPMHIHFEDPTQHETVAGTKKLIEWYGDVLEPMLSLDDDIESRLTATTTRKGRKDFVNYLFDDGWDEFRYAAVILISGRWPVYTDMVFKDHITRSGQKKRKLDYIRKTGEFELFNPRWNLQTLLELSIKKRSSFMSQRQNTPISVDSDFLEPLDIISAIDRVHFEGQEVMIIDPAFGKSSGSSETAIIVGFSVPNIDDIYVTEIVIDRLPGTKLVKKVYDLWDKHKVKWGRIENDFVQITTRQNTYQALRQLPNMGVFYNKGYGDKHARVQMLEEPLAMKHIHVFDTCTDLHKLEDQVNGYSEEADINHGFDGLDVLASFHRLVSKSGRLYASSWTSRR